MDDLIAALTIFRKYGNPRFPTHCNHDELTVAISPEAVSQEDLEKLKELSFVPDSYGDGFCSMRFGSC